LASSPLFAGVPLDAGSSLDSAGAAAPALRDLGARLGGFCGGFSQGPRGPLLLHHLPDPGLRHDWHLPQGSSWQPLHLPQRLIIFFARLCAADQCIRDAK
jgi:hypothetical protein